jgi:hypothetical protein
LQDEKDELLEQLREVTGFEPIGARRFLDLLAQPDLIEYTKRFIHSRDEASRCTNYKAPWSCIKESDARYENIKYGWLGGVNTGAGISEWWCENCRKKVMEEE